MPDPNQPPDTKAEATLTDGLNMISLCRTLARVLALLDEKEYTDKHRQDSVLTHDALPDPASESAPARLAE